MRIIISTNIRVPWGGSEELWLAFAKASVAAGNQVYVSKLKTPVASKLKEAIDKGVKIIYRRGYYKADLLRFQRILLKGTLLFTNILHNPYKKTFSLKPDIIIYNDSSYYVGEDSFFYKKVKKSGVPIVVINQIIADFHILNTKTGIRRAREIFIIAKKIFFVAQRNLETAERQLCLPLKNAAIARNPVNLQNINIVTFPEKTTVTHFAVVGNLQVAHKGQDILLQVLSAKKWKDRNWVLNIFGDGPDEHYLKLLAEIYSLKEKVLFQGKSQDIRSIWLHNECLISPSIMEGTPLVMVEAMLCGRMCIMTDVGGNREWVEDGMEGYIAEAPTVFSIDQTLERAWINKANWKKMGEKAREKALNLYDRLPGETILSYINALLKSSSPPN